MGQTHPFAGVQCWNPDRINVVVNKEAVSVDRANFLATHAPLDHIRYERAPHAMEDAGETGLLQSLLDSQARDEHAFVVVRGIPGTGKSHLIRWLKERYEADQSKQGGHDVVLLIERAQCTLRGSIDQIIRSGVFDDSHMRQQLERLQGAASALSKQTLADSVLFQLHLAVSSELDTPTIPRPPMRLIQNLPDFLLDRSVREHLKRKGGPIDRIVRFLAYDRDAAMAANETPEFVANDFDLPPTVRSALNSQGYQSVRNLARDLETQGEWRLQLARYLNQLMNAAVGRLTSLTADDLKGMFSELRRQLREQGKGLALFIEDITAFTGIDRGLVDVLATQHTGVANQQFCRMLSVIGVTDSYYHDSFPDNIKERVTLHLSLNAGSDDATADAREADMLRSESAIGDLAGRYLNAMRLTQEELDDWLAQGADPQHLPNACARCQYQPTCHPAFGQAQPRPGESRQPIGLYPFNASALTKLYQGLKGATHTPRSFLNDVLAYVMLSYGDQVRSKQFPPSPADLKSRFRLPRLTPPEHFRTIESQAGSERSAGRVETLVRLWGNQSAYSVDNGATRSLGGLPEEVFTAFQAPFITGEPAEGTLGAATQAQQADGRQIARHDPEREPERLSPISTPVSYAIAPDTRGKPEVQPPPQSARNSMLFEDLERWRQEGSLTQYDVFAERLATFLRTAIAWDTYGITREVVDKRLQKQRLLFEGQSGRKSTTDYIEFPRSSETVSTLLALLSLTESYDPNAHAANAGHMTDLGVWLHVHEPEIVAFVAETDQYTSDQMTTLEVSLLTAATFEVLSGELDRSHDSPETLLQAILARAIHPPNVREVAEAAEGVRSPAWVEALKAAALPLEAWQRLLSLLNRTQGRRTESGESGAEETARRPIYFLDVAPALARLQTLFEDDWSLPPRQRLTVGKVSAATPGSLEKAYDDVRTQFDAVLQEAQETCMVWKRELEATLGQESAEDTLNALSGLLGKFQRAQMSYDHQFDRAPSAAVMENARSGLEAIVSVRSRAQLALALSNALQTIKDARRTTHFFVKNLAPFLIKTSESLATKLDDLRGALETQALTEKVEQEYDELEEELTGALSSSAALDARAVEVKLSQTGGAHE